MKEQEQYSSNRIDTQPSLNQRRSSRHLFDTAKCPFGNQCYELCCYNKCTEKSVICGSRTCKCQAPHREGKLCLKLDPNVLVDRIRKRQLDHNYVQSYISHLIKRLIEYLSDFEHSVEDFVRNLRLSEAERKFIDLAESEKFDAITGKLVSEVFKAINMTEAERFDSILVKHEVKNFWKDKLSEIQQGVQGLCTVIQSNLGKSISDFSHPESTMSDFSLILKDTEKIDVIERALSTGNKSVRTFDLLYRGSEHDFDLELLKNTCTGLKNTLTISRTGSKDVECCFCPNPWDFHGKTMQNVNSIFFQLHDGKQFVAYKDNSWKEGTNKNGAKRSQNHKLSALGSTVETLWASIKQIEVYRATFDNQNQQ